MIVLALFESAAADTTQLRASPAKHDTNGASENVDIEPNGPVPHVVDVHLEPLCESSCVSIADLPQAGHSGHGSKNDSFVPSHVRDLAFEVGPRTDEAHFPTKNVPELGDFIEAVLTQDTSHTGDTGIE